MSLAVDAIWNRSYDVLRRAYRLAKAVKRRLSGETASSHAADTPYQAWLSRRMASRSARYPKPVGTAKFSVITPVYERTNIAFFLEAASSILGQSYGNLEWVIVADGAIPSELLVEIHLLRRDSRVRFHSAEKGGIIRTMRRALEDATGDYVVPIDGDDLLTRDALDIFAGVIDAEGRPAFVYSDEDHLIRGRPDIPYFRPDWDPVLNVTSSWVWHLMAFSRGEAMKLGVYSDARSNWCHDWDTIFRFVDAGHTPRHVPEVLYHWRQHEASSTNQASPVSESLDSQRHVLELHLARLGLSDRFDIEEFPIFRGAKEWWLRAKADSEDAIAVISMSERGGVAALREKLAEISSELVAVMDGRIRPHGDLWRTEALGQFTLHPDCALLSARVLDDRLTVIGGGEIFGLNGIVGSPSRGCRHDDGGMFALNLKPRSVSAVDSRFFVARREFLLEALSGLPREASYAGLGAWLGAAAMQSGRRVIFTPLVAGVFVPVAGEPPWAGWADADESAIFRRLHGDKIPDLRWYLAHAPLETRS